RHDRQEILVALDTRGEVVARSDTFAPLVIRDVERTWLEPALEGRRPEGVLEIDGKLHHGVAAAAESGGTIFGYLLALAPVAEAWARSLRDASGKEIVVLSAKGLAASTIAASRVPWKTAADFPKGAGVDVPQDVDLGGEGFQILPVTVAPPEALTIL